jgi:hypothetical protein
MSESKFDTSAVDIERVETVSAIDEHEKAPSTAYVPESQGTDSHHKSAAERSLVLKSDLVILPLAAVLFFVAYLVSADSTLSFKQSEAPATQLA